MYDLYVCIYDMSILNQPSNQLPLILRTPRHEKRCSCTAHTDQALSASGQSSHNDRTRLLREWALNSLGGQRMTPHQVNRTAVG